MDLGGSWLATVGDDELRRRFTEPDLDERGWDEVEVPGHWQSTPSFADSPGPVLYRRRFDAAVTGETTGRAWLTLEGIFYQADVWLDGSYLGQTEGYFAPTCFEVTDTLRARSEHVLAVEVACPAVSDQRRKRALTGIFQEGASIDPTWNPGGIWAPVHLEHTGPVRLRRLRTLCREASAERATLEFEADLDAATPTTVSVGTTLSLGASVAARSVGTHRLARGANRVHWRVGVERPALWWPRALGAQPLYDVSVSIGEGDQRSDGRNLTTGLRRVRMRRFVVSVNGERLYLKGAHLAPTRRALGEVTAAAVGRDLQLARDAGLDLLRVHAHVGPPALYEGADRAGMLLWQDLPLLGGYGQVRRQAVRQARQAVDLLGHHPSVALWCAHDEPFALPRRTAGERRTTDTARLVAAQLLPTWNKTALDGSLRRTLERSDGSRPVVAHSGVWPHPAGATDTHTSIGWARGDYRDLAVQLARLPVLARFVGRFGAQAVPSTDAFLRPERWPDLDWEELTSRYGMERDLFALRLPPSDFPDFAQWRQASQAYQAELVHGCVETLRRLKYRPSGGFCMFMLADPQPAVSASVLDHERNPKLAYAALRDACAPVVLIADPLAASYAPGTLVELDVHAVSDLRHDLTELVASAALRWPGGGREWRFAGDLPADSCVRIARLRARIPDDAPPGELHLDLRLVADGEPATAWPVVAHYASRLDQPPVARKGRPARTSGRAPAPGDARASRRDPAPAGAEGALDPPGRPRPGRSGLVPARRRRR